jgi:hypothetical protein
VRSTDIFSELTASRRDASLVRSEIARLFEAGPAGRIVLAPGILAALRELFSAAAVDRLVLTSEEYYAPRHFPALSCRVVSPSQLVARVLESRPAAVVASLISWRGEPLPVAAAFAEIRQSLGSQSPLLVADYTHAGAVGFPPVSGLNADIVCGDPEKWLLPPQHASRLAFLWLRSKRLFRAVRPAFAPFFLALAATSDPRSARWLDPGELHRVAAWLSDRRLTRAALRSRHEADVRLRHRIARTIGIAAAGDVSVLWTDARIPRSLEARLARRGLLWPAGHGRTRILCRADVRL